ncbi:MAG: stage III sporulation protein AF [Syntrophomonadaceae bacterium]|jgi:stage III sporulation protein AF
MDVLIGIVKSVLVIIILASFMEILLPEGKVKPFVRFAIGLFIIISVLNPVLNVVFQKGDFQVNLWDYQISPEQEKEILERGSRINQQIVTAGEVNLRDKIEGQISAVTMLIPGVKEVETSASFGEEGEINKLVLIVRPEQPTPSEDEDENEEVNAFLEGGDSIPLQDKKQMEEKIKGVINNFYGFKDIEIEIKYEGG